MGHRESCQYTLFKTQWGWFGLLGNKQGLIRTYLPVAHKEAIQSQILSDFPNAKQRVARSSSPWPWEIQKAIESYYKGHPVDFREITVHLDGFTGFQQKALTTLRSVTYGKTISYGDLAKLSGSPKAARAIGSVMAQNPLPLIIPCHRVIKSDGTPGQFSAGGGINTKTRMLELEKSNRRK